MNEAHDYRGFYDEEIKLRQMMWYPPFSEMINIQFSGSGFQNVNKCAKYFMKVMEFIGIPEGEKQILGPIPCAVSRINNKYRWQIIIKCENADMYNIPILKAREKCAEMETYKNITISIDKNPLHIF